MHDHLLDSGALQTLNEVLGATGGGHVTRIDSSNLQLTILANDFVRRGRTPVISEGIYTIAMETVHAGAGSLGAEYDPYALGANAIGGYQSPLPRGLDAWVLAGHAYESAAITTNAVLYIAHPATKCARTTAAAIPQIIAAYVPATLAAVTVSGTSFHRVIGSGLVGWSGALRVPRGSTVKFDSLATGAGTIAARLVIGVFASGLGQDAIGTG